MTVVSRAGDHTGIPASPCAMNDEEKHLQQLWRLQSENVDSVALKRRQVAEHGQNWSGAWKEKKYRWWGCSVYCMHMTEVLDGLICVLQSYCRLRLHGRSVASSTCTAVRFDCKYLLCKDATTQQKSYG